jgi:hypothetical protein
MLISMTLLVDMFACLSGAETGLEGRIGESPCPLWLVMREFTWSSVALFHLDGNVRRQ